MTLVACGLLALGVLAYMISPMLEGAARRPGTARSALSAWSAWSSRSRRDDLLKKKDFIYASIRELNIDYNMGKLAADDHEALRQEYMKEASDVLDELDRTAGSDLPVEEQIEKAVLEIRRRGDPAPDGAEAGDDKVVDAVDAGHADVDAVAVEAGDDLAASAEDAVDAAAEHAAAGHAEDGRFVLSAGVLECLVCRTVNEQSAKFCIACGASLKRLTCGGCGAENPASARFCAQCGKNLI